MIISERIFKILQERGISQASFGKMVGLSSSTISDWKTKKTNPSADKIMDICAALDITPEQLLTGEGIDDLVEGLHRLLAQYKEENKARYADDYFD